MCYLQCADGVISAHQSVDFAPVGIAVAVELFLSNRDPSPSKTDLHVRGLLRFHTEVVHIALYSFVDLKHE